MGFMDRLRAAITTPATSATSATIDLSSIPDVEVEFRTLQGKVAGVSHYQDALWEVTGGDPDNGPEETFLEAVIEPDPTNQYDSAALKVTIDGRHVGFVPKDDQPEVAPRLAAAGGRLVAPAEIVGGTDGKSLGVRIWYSS